MNSERAAALWFDRASLSPLGAGHIHVTSLLEVDGEAYVLQCVNQDVFHDPQLVMAQTQRLLAHWRQQSRYRTPELVLSREGKTGAWLDGEFWRVWRYVKDSRVVDPIQTPAQARAAGAAFGALQNSLEDLPGARFKDTIPGFLQLEHYLKSYDAVAAQAPAALNKLVQVNRGLADQFGLRNANIHGDCKVNNLLFAAETDQVIAIIDFDTAMYGHWAWDFGDLVRSVCFSTGSVSRDYFSACLAGFAQYQRQVTVDDVVAAPAYVALMLGVRFLTDHLQGDIYFKVQVHGENLARAQQQFDLFEQFVARRPDFRAAAEIVLG